MSTRFYACRVCAEMPELESVCVAPGRVKHILAAIDVADTSSLSQIPEELRRLGRTDVEMEEVEGLEVYHYTDNIGFIGLLWEDPIESHPSRRTCSMVELISNSPAEPDMDVLAEYGEFAGTSVYSTVWASKLETTSVSGAVLGQDAVFGEGVYATELGPDNPRTVLAANNYFDLLKRAAKSDEELKEVDVDILLKEAISQRSNMDQIRMETLEKYIKRVRLDLWEKTKNCIQIIVSKTSRAKNLSEKYGGANRSLLMVASGRKGIAKLCGECGACKLMYSSPVLDRVSTCWESQLSVPGWSALCSGCDDECDKLMAAMQMSQHEWQYLRQMQRGRIICGRAKAKEIGSAKGRGYRHLIIAKPNPFISTT